MSERYFATHAWLPDGVARDVGITVVDGRFVDVEVAAVPQPGDRTSGRPDAARVREHAQPCVPSGAARSHARRRWHVLDVAGADVRRRRSPGPRQLPRAGACDVRRDGAGRCQQRRRVPLPAPRARRHALRRPERDGPRADPGSGDRPASGSPCSTPATSPADSGRADPSHCDRSRRASATATPTTGRPASRRSSPRRTPASARPSTRCGRYRASNCRPWWPAARGKPLHVHLSEQPAENEQCRQAYGRTPTELLADAGCPGSADHRRARDPPDRLGRQRARRRPDVDQHVPDDRARPRRRHRSGASARRRRLADRARQRPARGDRPARRGPRPGDGRAAGQPAARPVHRRRAGRGTHRRRATRPRLAGRRPDRAGARADLTTVRLDTVRTAGSRSAAGDPGRGAPRTSTR